MAKKRPHEIADETLTESIPTQGVHSDVPLDSLQTESVNEPADPLLEEVQSFLNLRDELARKLAAEIELTEQKLAELKKTAASLFPGAHNDVSDDRKPKKPKAKPTPPKEKGDSPTSATEKVASSDSA